QREGGIRKTLADIAERQPDLPERSNLLKPSDVGRRIPPMRSAALTARREETDLLVVVQGAHGESRASGEVADAKELRLCSRTRRGTHRSFRRCKALEGTTSRYVRFKGRALRAAGSSTR